MAPNLLWKCPPLRGGHIQNLKKILWTILEIQAIKLSKNSWFLSSSFRTLCVNRYNSRMRASIWLKFGAHVESLKANTSIKFEINPINIQVVVSNFTHKTKLNFCQVYRVNHYEEQAENWYVASLTSKKCLWVVKNQSHKRQKRYAQLILRDKSFLQYHTNYLKWWAVKVE